MVCGHKKACGGSVYLVIRLKKMHNISMTICHYDVMAHYLLQKQQLLHII